MKTTDRHYCEKYCCDLAAGACEARYQKVLNRPKQTLWSHLVGDHCESCADGKRILNDLGKDKVAEYSATVNRSRHITWKRMEGQTHGQFAA